MAQTCTAIESPCVRVCVIGAASGWRTLDEISFWVRYMSEERCQVMQHLEARHAAACATP